MTTNPYEIAEDGDAREIRFLDHSRAAYEMFLRCKHLPRKEWRGRTVHTDRWSLARILGEPLPEESLPVSEYLFDYQRFLVRRALAARSYGIWADCGLGKTAMMLEWARHLEPLGPVLFVCPLSVVEQTQEEAERFYGERFVHRLDHLPSGSPGPGTWIINFERLKTDADFSAFHAVALDECSILKNKFGVTARTLTAAVRGRPYRLALSATPAPNEYIEYANIALWLGVVRPLSEFFASFFVHDEDLGRWRLKRHAERAFWEWVSSWALYINDPAAWGFSPVPLRLPRLEFNRHVFDVSSDAAKRIAIDTGELFHADVGKHVKRSDLARVTKREPERYDIVARIRESRRDTPSLIWCHHNIEQTELKARIPDALIIDGSTPPERREEIRRALWRGEVSTIISKPSVLSQGVNLQVCGQVIFCSLSDSFQDYYQAMKRVHRYGGLESVDVHVVVSTLETAIVENLQQKQARYLDDVRNCERVFIESENRR
jgi:hypothetical protein